MDINFVKGGVVPLLFCLSKKEAEPGRKKDNTAVAAREYETKYDIFYSLILPRVRLNCTCPERMLFGMGLLRR